MSKSIKKQTGNQVRLFGERIQTPDESVFQVDNTSEQYFNSPYYLAHINNVQPVPPGGSSVIQLGEIIGQAGIDSINKTGRIIFHSVGDTGAAKTSGPVTEARVADMMVKDFDTPVVGDRPSFFFHLGDVIYYFGEQQYYYDQFYEPFRMYNAPIFAIPGNHDGVIYEASAKSLDAFINNFCTPAPLHSANAGGLVRTTMTQPNVYFTLDAPFISIIGLYSNVLEGPGVISSQGGKYPIVDDQKSFLIAELKRLKPKRNNNEIGIIVAVHHPPFSGDQTHSGSTGLMNDLDDAFKQAGLIPDMVLSGHAHIYQRFTRQVNKFSIPYIISGSGGFAMTPLKTLPGGEIIKTPFQETPKGPVLEKYIPAFGYLKLMATSGMIGMQFNSSDPAYGPNADSIFVDLKSHVITAGKPGKKLI